MSHILVHSLPILGNCRSSCTDLKCTPPLHIFIEQKTQEEWDRSLPILDDGSSSTEVDDELKRQELELEPEQTQEQQEEGQQHKKNMSKKKGQGEEEQ